MLESLSYFFILSVLIQQEAMLKLGRVVRSNIIKGKIDTINISKTLLTTLPHKECDIDLFSSTLKKCGYSLTVFSDSSSTSNSVEFKGLNDQPLHAINLQNTQQLFVFGASSPSK